MSVNDRRERDGWLTVLLTAITQNPRFLGGQLMLAAKLVSRRAFRLPGAKKFALTLLLVVLIVYGMFSNRLMSDSFLEVDKCPACFGFKLCTAARSGNVWFTGWSKIRLLDYVTNVDNIYTGVADGKAVVIKKLATNRDIAAWEQRICKMAHKTSGCEISHAAVKALMASGSNWMTSYVSGMSKLTACPTERLLEKVMDRYQEKLDAINLSARERIQLILTIMLNQEPIIFQTFPKSEGWPFPAYIGACGRYVAIESEYWPLREYSEATWSIRANLALKLLLIAKKFVENKSQYGLYWTDISYATFAVNDTSLDVFVVDGSNIMVVDLYQIKEDQKRNWDRPLLSHFDTCADRDVCPLSDETLGALCDRHVTDHNYYAVCRYILSPHAGNKGLLHDMPSDVDSVYGISELLESCTKPTQPRQRFDAAAQLMKALTELVRTAMPFIGDMH